MRLRHCPVPIVLILAMFGLGERGDIVGVAVLLAVHVGVAVLLALDVEVDVWDAVQLPEAVAEAEAPALSDADDVAVFEAVDVEVLEDVSDALEVDVLVSDELGVVVSDAVGVCEDVILEVGVFVGVAVFEGVVDGVNEPVGVTGRAPDGGNATPRKAMLVAAVCRSVFTFVTVLYEYR